MIGYLANLVFNFPFFRGITMTWTLHPVWVFLVLNFAPGTSQGLEPVRLGVAVKEIEVPALHQRSIAFTPDGKKVAWMHYQAERAPNDGGGLLIHLWDVEKRYALIEMKAANDFTWASSPLRFTPNGRMLVAGCTQLTTEFQELAAKPTTRVQNNLRIWLAASGKELPFASREDGTMRDSWQSVAFSPDGRTIIANTGKGGRVWKFPDGKVERRFNLEPALNVLLSSDGKLAAGTVGDSEVRVWTTEDGKQATQLVGAGRSLGFAHDGKQMATFDGEKVCLWDLQSGKQAWAVPAKLGSGEQGSQGFDFSPDGKRIAWNEGGKIMVVDATTGKTIVTFTAQPGPLAFSPDGRRLAVACPDGTALVWNLSRAG
jgi:WD40 repeat protein